MTSVQIVDQLRTFVESSEMFSSSSEFSNGFENLLNARDSEAFETMWLAVFNSIDSLNSRITSTQLEAIDRLRETSFGTAFAFSQNPDFAAIVSDDFELIGKAVLLGLNDPQLNALWMSYRDGGFPINPSGGVDGDLASLVL